MARVKGGNVAKNRRRKILKLAKGYYGSKRTLYKTAHEQVMKSLTYAYRDRKQRKRNFRRLWIQRINAATRIYGLSYSRFMNGLKKANIEVNRKMLAEIAVSDIETFGSLVETSKKALGKNFAQTAIVTKKTVNKTVKVATEKVTKTVEVAKEKVAKSTKVATEKVSKTVEVIKEKTAPTKKVDTEIKVATDESLESLTVVKLRSLAKEKDIAGFSTMKKAELIEALK